MVIWVYYSAQIFFFGAEFTHVHALWERSLSASNGRTMPQKAKPPATTSEAS